MQAGTSANTIGSGIAEASTTATEVTGASLNSISPTGEQLAQGLAHDQAYREERRRAFHRRLAPAAALERWGRYACVAAGLICPLAISLSPDHTWLQQTVFARVLPVLLLAGLGLVVTGGGVRRFWLGVARRQAIDLTPLPTFEMPESLPDWKVRELQLDLEAIRSGADEAERACVGCAWLGLAVVMAPWFEPFWENGSLGWGAILLLGAMVMVGDLYAALARITAWWSYRSWLRRSAAAGVKRIS